MSGNIIKNCSNFIEQSCNEVTRDIIGGFISPVEKVITNNIEKVITNNIEKVIANNDPIFENSEVKTNYILFGYEMSSPVFILLMVVLLIVVLYIIFKLYKWLFAPKDDEIVSIQKFKHSKKKNSSDNESGDNTEDTGDDESITAPSIATTL